MTGPHEGRTAEHADDAEGEVGAPGRFCMFCVFCGFPVKAGRPLDGRVWSEMPRGHGQAGAGLVQHPDSDQPDATFSEVGRDGCV